MEAWRVVCLKFFPNTINYLLMQPNWLLISDLQRHLLILLDDSDGHYVLMIADQVWKHTFDQAKEWPHGAVGHQVEQVLHENHDPAKGVSLPLIVVFDHLDFALDVSDFIKGLLR